jgi:hypothetical protein
MTTDWTQPEPATHSVPDLDLGALERAARAATPGEWYAWKGEIHPRFDNGRQGTFNVVETNHASGSWDQIWVKRDLATAQYIAAWSPATALRVLAELRAARDAAADAVEGR